eukprot:SAG11_NODE_3857_length_2189_cov_4.381340_4_plen_163_part_00
MACLTAYYLTFVNFNSRAVLGRAVMLPALPALLLLPLGMASDFGELYAPLPLAAPARGDHQASRLGGLFAGVFFHLGVAAPLYTLCGEHAASTKAMVAQGTRPVALRCFTISILVSAGGGAWRAPPAAVPHSLPATSHSWLRVWHCHAGQLEQRCKNLSRIY